MKKILFTVLLILFSIPCFALGVMDSAERSELQFAILIKKGDENWYRKEAEGFIDRCNELGVQPLIMDNKSDPNITLVNMDLAIEKQIDAVAIVIPERRMGPVIVDRAFESDTAIVSLDHKLLDHQGRQLAPHIGLDDASAGYSTGYWLANLILRQDWYVNRAQHIGIAALTNEEVPEYHIRVNECKRALFEWLPEIDDDHYYRIENSGSDAVGGLLAMQELLNIHPEITNWIVISATDEASVGAVRALEQVGLGPHSIACGIQAERAFSEFAKDEKTAFACAVYYDPYQLGRRAADSLYDFITAGSIIPAVTSVPFRIISRENYAGIEE